MRNPFADREGMEEVDSNALDDDASAPFISSMISRGGDGVVGGGGNPFADDFDDHAPIRPPSLNVPATNGLNNAGPLSAPAQVNRNTLFESGTSFPETFNAGPSTVPRRHTTDAFEGLVHIGRKNDAKQIPDPPRGPSMKPAAASPTTASDAFNAFDSLG